MPRLPTYTARSYPLTVFFAALGAGLRAALVSCFTVLVTVGLEEVVVVVLVGGWAVAVAVLVALVVVVIRAFGLGLEGFTALPVEDAVITLADDVPLLAELELDVEWLERPELDLTRAGGLRGPPGAAGP